MIYGDYHTHTKYSDGHNSVEEIVNFARAKGMKEVAITDHGFYNMCHHFALTKEKYALEKEDVKVAREKYDDIKILLGVEADIVDTNGTIDMTDEELRDADILTMGFHRYVKSTSIKDYFRFVFFNGFMADVFGTTVRKERDATKSYVEALKKYPIDILAHINNHARVDVYEVCKTCAEVGTLVEINMKHIRLARQLMPTMLKTDCKFIINSDAHKAEKVADFDKALQLISEFNIPEDRVVNLNKAPTFTRLNEYKAK